MDGINNSVEKLGLLQVSYDIKYTPCLKTRAIAHAHASTRLKSICLREKLNVQIGFIDLIQQML